MYHSKSGKVEDVDLDKLLDVNSGHRGGEGHRRGHDGHSLHCDRHTNLLPYVEQSTLELTELTKHHYESIRKSSSDSPLQIIRTFYELSEPAEW